MYQPGNLHRILVRKQGDGTFLCLHQSINRSWSTWSASSSRKCTADPNPKEGVGCTDRDRDRDARPRGRLALGHSWAAGRGARGASRPSPWVVSPSGRPWPESWRVRMESASETSSSDGTVLGQPGARSKPKKETHWANEKCSWWNGISSRSFKCKTARAARPYEFHF